MDLYIVIAGLFVGGFGSGVLITVVILLKMLNNRIDKADETCSELGEIIYKLSTENKELRNQLEHEEDEGWKHG